MERWQRLTIATLVVLLIAGLVLVRLMLDLNELRRQTNTQRLIERVARQVEMYRSARGFLPSSLDDLMLELPPEFTNSEGEALDGWGNPLYYTRAASGRREQYVIASPGRDGNFDEPPDRYAERRSFSSNRGRPDRDTVLVGGRVVQGPVEEARR